MDSANFKLEKIGVIMLDVRNLPRSVTFYRDNLGLALQQQFEAFAFFNGGGVMLVLRESRTLSGVPGATEVVFSVDGVREAFAALKGKGVTFVNEPRVVSGPMWGANFNDPDGHRLSLFGPERKA
jgi:catechol 2,3-dioxygenase-like lactoylglutathione lyase family enzyme